MVPVGLFQISAQLLYLAPDNFYSSQRTIKTGDTSNLITHRDGNSQREQCKKRHLAYEQDSSIGLGFKDSQSKSLSHERLDKHLKVRFTNTTLQRMLVIWQIRNALPWTRLQDSDLRAAFQYCNPQTKLCSDTWAANLGKELFLALKLHAQNDLKVNENLVDAAFLTFNQTLPSKFSMKTDVWTTKSSRFAFIGSVTTWISQVNIPSVNSNLG